MLRTSLLASSLLCGPLVCPTANANEPSGNLSHSYPFICATELKIRPLSDLTNKVRNLALEFRITPYLEKQATGGIWYEGFLGSYQLFVSKDGKDVGHLLITRMAGDGLPPIYQSHIGIQPQVRGNGVGALLYALGARFIFRMKGSLHSTDSLTENATLTWERLTNAGWAIQRLDPHSLTVTPYFYEFREELLRNGFFDPLDQLLNGFESVRDLKPIKMP